MKDTKNKRKILFFILCFSIFYFAGCNLNSEIYKKGEVIINNQIIKVEIADKPELMLKGLSGRKNLAENSGMLFIFSKPDIYKFWMKEMKFPLDIIWIQTRTNADLTQTYEEIPGELVIGIEGQIVEIWQNAPIPQTKTEIPLYRPQNLANYVLEVKAGTVEKYGWKVGDEVEIRLYK